MKKLPSTIAIALCLLAPAEAAAIPEGSAASTPTSRPAPKSQPTVSPPKLKTFVKATYPKGKKLSAEVHLALTIEVDGTVSQVSVRRSAGHAFDQAALKAARGLRFSPAKVGGKAQRVRIGFRYRFDAPKPKPRLATLRIGIRDPDGLPLAGAQVHLLLPGTLRPLGARSDSAGAVTFLNLPPKTVTVSIIATGYEPLRRTETLQPGGTLEVLYRPRPKDRPKIRGYGATGVVERPPREVVRRVVDKQIALSVAGTRGDPLRSIEVLPGVARPAFGDGVVIVRGAAPADTQVFFEGATLPLLYHFGAITSFMHPQLLERIELFPGNFSVRYGRRVGGVVEVQARAPKKDGWHGTLDVNLIDASLLLETPLTEKLSVVAALRRSYIDAWITPLLADDFTSIVAPAYWDYQLITNYEASKRDLIRLKIYGSHDLMRFDQLIPEDDNPDEVGTTERIMAFYRGDITWKHRYADWLRHEVLVSAGYTETRWQLGGAISTYESRAQIDLRAEWDLRATSRLRLRFGTDIQLISYELDYFGGRPGQEEGQGGDEPEDADEKVSLAHSGRRLLPALYLEGDWRPVDGLQIIAGVRADYLSGIERWTVDPRLTVIKMLPGKVRLKAGVGLFSQPPSLLESDEVFGNPELSPIRAVHAGLGLERAFDEVLTVGVEGFYKHLLDRPVATPNKTAPYFVSRGKGRVYGLELSAKITKLGGFYGLLSYTLSRSERRDNETGWRLFDYDQTHILNVAAGYRFGKGWHLGMAFRLISGNPITPAVGSVYDAAEDRYRPIFGAINSHRDAFYHRLDVRIEKAWRVWSGSIALYLDVQNAYNQQNAEGYEYNYDFSQRQALKGLPIIPSLGVRGTL